MIIYKKNNNFLYKINIKDKIHSIKTQIINQAIIQRFKKLDVTCGFNFELDSEHKDYLYSILLEESKKIFGNFTLADENFKLWCYFTDKKYSNGNGVWHNHITTSTINCVIYLKTIKKCGIEFEDFYVEANDYDMLIFPGHMNHRPIINSGKERISLNLELRHF